MASAAPPLIGVRVLDLTRVLAGPHTTLVLSDLGADVVKVEQPTTGDDSRRFGPFLGGTSGYFASVNRGKRSVCLDLKSEADGRLFLALVERADVLVENFRPGVMDGLGFAWARLSELNPRLIYASCSGFGQTGPYAAKPAYDVIIQAMSGLISVTGSEPDSVARVGVSISDLGGSLFAVAGILAALFARERTGRGQVVDISLLDSSVALLENAIVRCAIDGHPPQPLGTRHPSITPFQVFSTADGRIAIAAGNDHLWGKLCRAVGAPALAEDARFATNSLRSENHSAVELDLTRVLSSRTAAEWLEILEAAGVPCGPVNRVDEVMRDPQILDRGMLAEATDRHGNRFQVAASPLHLSETAIRVGSQVPDLGEHTDEVIADWLNGEKQGGSDPI